MYLSNILIENFRIFGSQAQDEHLHLHLEPGLNVLVGENDSGKSAVIDAIRHVLWTTTLESIWLSEDDFHVSGSQRADNLSIRCKFCDLSHKEQARFLEWLTVENHEPCLYVTLQATLLARHPGRVRWQRRISVTRRSGKNADGPQIEGEIREFLRTTYLRPLRDAEAELSPGRGSRLSQILQSHREFEAQARSDYDADAPDKDQEPTTLVGIMRQAERRIGRNRVIDQTQTRLNDEYLSGLSIATDPLAGEINVARQSELRDILEKLELYLRPGGNLEVRTPRGLGFNNVLFISTELLLLGGEPQEDLPLLLVEEPEAHLHPQMQLLLMDFLQKRSSNQRGASLQTIVTTHSPNLASKVDLQNLILMHGGVAYPLASQYTKLDESDYRFLQRFLDVTKANLFFAKGVLIIEGDAENILIPALANLLGRPFHKYGVSIVSVGHRGLFRYARIFQRADGQDLPIRVACVADRDIVPDAATYVKHDHGAAKLESDFTEEELCEHVEAIRSRAGIGERTFVSPKWTLEHDLAYCGLALEVHTAIHLARRSRQKPAGLSSKDRDKAITEAEQEFARMEQAAASNKEALAAEVYERLYRRHASKAETAQFLAERLATREHLCESELPDYLVQAIRYVTGGDQPDA